MKRILRTFLVEAGVLYLTSQITSGLHFESGAASIIATAVVLAVATFLVKPVVNILLLPLNILTFGLFKWIGQAIVLYLVDLVVSQFSVGNFDFAGYTSEWVVIPPLSFGIPVSYLAFAFLLSLLASFIYWLVD